MANYLILFLFTHLKSEREFPSWECFMISCVAQLRDKCKLPVFVPLVWVRCISAC